MTTRAVWATLGAILIGATPLGCLPVGPRPSAPTEPAAASARWVDAFAAEGGDGSQQRPFRDLKQALQSPGEVHQLILRAGLYAGPFTVPASVQLRGPRTAVLHAEQGTVVQLAPGAALHGLSVEGGAVGAELQGDAALEAVAFSGQRTVAIAVRSGTATLDGCRLEAPVSEAVGLRVDPAAEARVTRLEVRGPFRRAIEVRERARLALDGGDFRDSVTAVFGVGAFLVLHDLVSEGGRGPAVFAAQGQLQIDGLRVVGHEFGLQTREVQQLRARRLELRRSERAGLALVLSSGTVDEVTVLESGPYGGIQLVRSDVTVSHFRVEQARELGVNVREGHVTLRDGVVRRVAASSRVDGDGLELRAAAVTVEDVTVSGAEGLGVLAAEHTTLELSRLTLEDCRAGGLMADAQAQVHGQGLTVSRPGGPAIVVPSSARVSIDGLSFSGLSVFGGAEGPVFAECGQGARVELSHVQSDSPVLPAPCVQLR